MLNTQIPDIGSGVPVQCAGRTQHRGGEYTCTSAVSTTLLLISNVTILRSSQVVFLDDVVNRENNLKTSIYHDRDRP